MIALLTSVAALPVVASACGGVVSSTAEAATVVPSTIALSPPTVPPPTMPAPVITAPPTTLPPPEPMRIAAQRLDVPLMAVGTQDGEETKRVQQRLLDLGFWLQSVNGDYGVTTSQAVMAFQKYMGLPATAEVDEATAALLTVADMRANGSATGGTLIEVDKDRQLMFIIRDAATLWTINVSTGSGIPFKERDKTEWGKWIQGDAKHPMAFSRSIENESRAGTAATSVTFIDRSSSTKASRCTARTRFRTIPPRTGACACRRRPWT